LLNESTGRARKIAAQRILTVLDDHEKQDLRAIDLDTVFQRFANKNAKDFTPESLASYRSRLRSAIDDFLKYVSNPAAFRTGTISRTSRRAEAQQDESAGKTFTKRFVRIRPAGNFGPPPGVVFPIPLRPDLVVQLHGLPADLTQAEADRIAAVVKALAVVGNERKK